MKTVLIAGGGGYIGSILTQVLLDAGHQVRVLDRFFFRRGLLADLENRDGLVLFTGDTRYASAEVFRGVDVVMDLAGISNDPACDLDPKITEEINIGGPQHMVAIAKAAGVKHYIYSSSCSVYGQGPNDPLTEDSPTAPVSLYAKSKIESERELLKSNGNDFAVTVLRNATAYGLSRRMRFDLVINVMTLYAYKARRIHVLGGGRQWRPLIHVRDIANAFLLVMEAPRQKVAGEIFNVGSNEQNYQVYQIAQMVRDVVPHTDVEIVPDDPDKRSYLVDFTKFNRALDFKVEKSPYEGIVEIKQALERGKVDDTVATKTVHYYRYLIDAERLLAEVSYDGRIF